jgi:hypothetical protein
MYPAALRGLLGTVLFALCLAAQAATTIVLNAVADNSLFSESDVLSDGAGPHLWVGRTAGGVDRRALVRFDLTAVPQDSVVVGARLRMFMSRTISPDQDISVRRLTASWGEGTSTAGSGGTGALATAADATWGFRFFGTQARWTSGAATSSRVRRARARGSVSPEPPMPGAAAGWSPTYRRGVHRLPETSAGS